MRTKSSTRVFSAIAVLVVGLLAGAMSGANADDVAAPTTSRIATVKTASADRSGTDRVSADTSRAPKPVNCAIHKCVALTYDDGPAGSTPALLRTLAAKKAPATFFVLGQQATKYPATMRAIRNAGHEIGVHTWDHANLTKLSSASVTSELDRSIAAVRQTTGQRTTLMRPPYGATNQTVRSVEGRLGLAEILWSVDPQDWKDRNTATVTQRVLAAAKPGAIVLMHDIHPTTVAAAPAIIDGLRKRGYRLVTVSQLLGKPTPGRTYSSR
jgi:peptidoglycan/xylan/chitin deacetylase (PgdA/CDA1 family)